MTVRATGASRRTLGARVHANDGDPIEQRWRRCPTCDALAGDRTARWCGTCGSLLPSAEPGPGARGTPRWRLRGVAASVTLALLALGGAAVSAGDGWILRVGTEDPIAGAEVELPYGGESLGHSTADTPARVGDGRSIECLVEGCIVWERSLQLLTPPPSIVVQEGIIVTSRVKERWIITRSSGDVSETPSLAGIAVIEAADGEYRWGVEVPIDGSRAEAAHVVVVGGQLLVVDGEGTLRSFDLHDGEPRWQRPVDARQVVQAQLVGPDLLAVVSTQANGVAERALSLDPATGAVRWTSAPADRVVLTPAGPVLLDAFGEMRGLDPRSGAEHWHQPMEALGPSLALGELLVAVGDDRTTVIDARDGALRTTLPSGRATEFGPPQADHDGLVIPDHDGVSYLGVDGSSWTTRSPGCCRGSALDTDTVTVLLDDGRVQRLARDDGHDLGRPRAIVPPGGSSEDQALVGGYVISAEGDGGSFGEEQSRHLVVRDAGTGRPLARMGPAFPAGLTDDGALVLVVRPGRLLALRPPSDDPGKP